jgi:microcystin-dependent protein
VVASNLSSDPAFLDDLAAVAVAMSVPAGTVVAYTGDISLGPPDGWLICDGLEVSRTTFPELFAAIGVSHGIGDGTTTFNLPDYRGRFLRGVDMGAGRDPDAASRVESGTSGNAGDEVGTVQMCSTAMPNNPFSTSTNGNHRHAHDPEVTHPNGGLEGLASNPVWIVSPGYTDYAGIHSHTVSGGGDNETRPENVYLYYIIKY